MVSLTIDNQKIQVKEGTTIELEKSDNVETKTKYIQDEKTNII